MFKRITTIILSVLLFVSLVANGYLYYFYKNTQKYLEQKIVELEFLNNDINQIRSQAEQYNSPEKQVERLTAKVDSLNNKILELNNAQYKELKWLKYENKDLGISFEYPNLWGDKPIVTTNTSSIDWNDDFIKKCVSGYKPEQFLKESTTITFKGVFVNVQKFSKLSHLNLNLEYDCSISDIFDRAKYISDNSNIIIDGYKGKFFSGLNEGGEIFKSYSVITNDLTVWVQSYNFDYLTGLKLDTTDRFGDSWIEKLSDKYSNDERVKQLKLDLERLNKFVLSIKFIK